MLRDLRAREHQVITGLAVVETGPPGTAPRQETASVATRVRMGGYGDAEIDAYVATGEPLDKAGGYAVQRLGSQLVAAGDRCFTNAVWHPHSTTRGPLVRS